MLFKNKKSLEIIPCECGEYPIFIQPKDHYTDIWLECPKCKKRTYNTGGYDYAMEIPLSVAKKDAIKAWNNKEYFK